MPCGKPCDVHTNCIEGCHLPFIQCEECAQAMQGCCSQDCIDVIHLPEEEQKSGRGVKNGKKFSKRKIRCVDFKNREATQDPLAAIPILLI
jgi:UPF0176 protein